MEKFKVLLEAVLGLFSHKIEDELSDEQIANLSKELPAVFAERDAVKKTLADSQQEVVKLKADLEAKAKIADAYTARLRNDLSQAALQALGNDNGKVIVEMAASPSITIEQLEQLAQIYQKQAEEKFPLTCPKCGEKTSRQSSAKLSDPQTAKPPAAAPTIPGASELADKFRNKSAQ